MLRIVSQAIPPDNGEAYRRALAEARAALERAVAETVPADGSFEDRERAMLAAANDACRLALETTLQATAKAQPDQVRVDGVLYERHHEGTVVYHSLCGPLAVRRATYRETGERNGTTVVPLDLATGLIEGATPALAYRVALGYAQGPGRHAEEQMHADHRRPPSRSTLERLGKAIGTQTHRVAPRIEAALRREETVPEGTHAIVVGLDRTTVPMEEPRPAGAAPTTRRTPRTTPYVRTPPPPVDVMYRMAYVGTVSLVDRAGEALVTRRYAIASTEDPATLTARMMADLSRARARAKAPRLPVGVVQDAAPERWSLARTALTAETQLRAGTKGLIGITSTNGWPRSCGSSSPTRVGGSRSCGAGTRRSTATIRRSIGSPSGSLDASPSTTARPSPRWRGTGRTWSTTMPGCATPRCDASACPAGAARPKGPANLSSPCAPRGAGNAGTITASPPP